MIFSKNDTSSGTDGMAALAILKVLLEIMQTKKLLNKEEVAILLNCAEVEVDNTDMGGQITEAKFLIHNLMKKSDDTTRGYEGTTGS